MKILMPIDGSEQALATIKTAGQVLDKSRVQVYLLTVKVLVASEASWALVDDASVLKDDLRAAEVTAKEAGLNVVSVQHTTHHDAASAICQYANERGIEMIVMGSHGYQGILKLLMGSVSERVFQQARQPVLVIRNTATKEELDAATRSGLTALSN